MGGIQRGEGGSGNSLAKAQKVWHILLKLSGNPVAFSAGEAKSSDQLQYSSTSLFQLSILTMFPPLVLPPGLGCLLVPLILRSTSL